MGTSDLRPGESAVDSGDKRSLSDAGQATIDGGDSTDLGMDAAMNAPSDEVDLNLSAVAHGSGLYVIVGSLNSTTDSDSIILTSSDGKNWNLGYQGGDAWLTAVAYGNGRWVAVGWGGKSAGAENQQNAAILRSDDGISWELADSPSATQLGEVVWTQSEFLVRGRNANGKATIWASTAGKSWAVRSSGDSTPDMLTVGTLGTLGHVAGGTALSTDGGATWTQSAPIPYGLVVGLWAEDQGFGGSLLDDYSYGELPSAIRSLQMRSADGLTWSADVVSHTPHSVAQLGDLWIGIDTADRGLIYRSSTADAWVAVPSAPNANAITAGTLFVAVGSGIAVSRDGVTWESAESFPDNFELSQ